MKEFIYALCSILLFTACQEDEDTNNFELPSSLVRFSQNESSSIEGAGYKKIPIQLDHPQEGKTLVHFTVGGSFTPTDANQPGDIRMITASPLLVEAGATQAFIEFEILEDFEFEADPEFLTITLNGILEGNAELSSQANERIYQHNIIENEFKLTLQWNQSEDNPSNVKLVVESPNNELLISEAAEEGERIILRNVPQHTTYLTTVWYYQGDSPIQYNLYYHKSGRKSILLKEGTFQTGEANRDFSLADGHGTRHFKLMSSDHNLQLLD